MSFKVAVEILRSRFKESKVPLLKPYRITATEISVALEIAAFPSGTALIDAVKNGIRPVLAEPVISGKGGMSVCL